MSAVLSITGMHRSGTSLITSWLEQCGLQIHDGHSVGSDKFNKNGYFEDKEFHELQSTAVSEAFPESRGWKVFAGKFLRFNDGQLTQAQKMIDIRRAKYSRWGWKDPRTCLFLEHWKEIIPNLKVLLIWRPAAAVASSLVKRSKKSIRLDRLTNRITLEESVKLWMHYNKLICLYKQKYPEDTVLLPLDHLIKDSRTALRVINEKFQTNFQHRSIHTIYDQSLLHENPLFSLTRLAARKMGERYRSVEIENALKSFSDFDI